MKRTNIYIADQQHEKLAKLAKQTGIKISEHIRRAVDEYLIREGVWSDSEEVYPNDNTLSE